MTPCLNTQWAAALLTTPTTLLFQVALILTSLLLQSKHWLFYFENHSIILKVTVHRKERTIKQAKETVLAPETEEVNTVYTSSESQQH